MKKNNKGRSGRLLVSFLGILFVWAFVLTGAAVGAPPHNLRGVEMTPGPRMIRAVEALANDYLAASDQLKLTPAQTEKIRKEVIVFKKDIWKQEAVLLGMFEEVGLRRRHALLTGEAYQATNVMTGVIETGQMIRLMRSIEALQAILNPAQKETFRTIRRPKLNLKAPEGFNMRIGLLALGQYKRAYGDYRKEIGLTEAQQVSLRNTLEEARREVIRIGTEIEISRTEAYDLLKEPIIDIKKTREAMEKNAKLEGVFFPKLSTYSKRFKEILTPAQVVSLRKARRDNRRGRTHRGRGAAVHANKGSASLLARAEELGLSPSQIEALVELEVAAIQQAQQDKVAHRIETVELEERIREGAPGKELEARIARIAQLTADMEKARLQKRVAGLKIL
ncbi:MAG: hypothetical protein ACE5J1_02945, partial [Nitrospiria bacterium]